MAGLWNRIHRTGLDGDGFGRLNVHLFNGAIKGYAGAMWTRTQIVQRLEAVLARNEYPPFDAAELADLDAIADYMDSLTTRDKYRYAAAHAEAANTAAEEDVISEAQWRADMEIA